MSPSKHTTRFASALVLLLTAALAIYGTRPPMALGPDAPPEQFSAARAMMHLDHFAIQPHPIGTQANREVRDYLVGTLRDFGAEVRVEKTTGIVSRGRLVRAGNAENIVATFRGSAHSRAVMLVAHYDTVPESPGAADDGAGVIAILESLRALGTRPALRNDLIVLFTDGEELGLLGATGFVEDHPDLATRVGVLLNLEARGTSGPAMMFETSDGNGWLVRELAHVAPHPMASSLMYSVYKILPNSTDLSALKTTGVPALNFAFTESFQNYHSRMDTRENLDPRSVQHLGANALALVRHFGNLPLTDIRRPDRVYFNWLGYQLVTYPMWVIWPVALATLALLGYALLRGRRMSQVQLSFGSLGAFVFLLLALAGAMLLFYGGAKVLLGTAMQAGDTPGKIGLFAGLVLLGFTVGASVLGFLSARLGVRSLHAGLLSFAAVFAAAVCLLLPGGSYLFQWPALFGTGSLLLGLRARAPEKAAIWALVAAIPAVLLLVPLTYLFFVNLDLNLLSLAAASILLSFLLAVSWPLLDFLLQPRRGILLTLALAALALIVGGAAGSRSNAAYPRRDTLFYSLNADEGMAKWISYDDAVDPWTRQILGAQPRQGPDAAFTAGSQRECLSGNAPVVALAAPSATVAGDQVQAGVRQLRLRVISARQAVSMSVRLPPDLALETVACNGRWRQVGASGERPWTVRLEAVPPEGMELEVRIRGGGPVKLWLADSSPGFPVVNGERYPSRPDDLMAESGSDVTLVARQLEF